MNSKAICAKNPKMNLRPESMDLSALLMPKTVFLELYLWKPRSSLCRCLKHAEEILLIPAWLSLVTSFIW